MSKKRVLLASAALLLSGAAAQAEVLITPPLVAEGECVRLLPRQRQPHRPRGHDRGAEPRRRGRRELRHGARPVRGGRRPHDLRPARPGLPLRGRRPQGPVPRLDPRARGRHRRDQRAAGLLTAPRDRCRPRTRSFEHPRTELRAAPQGGRSELAVGFPESARQRPRRGKDPRYAGNPWWPPLRRAPPKASKSGGQPPEPSRGRRGHAWR